MMWLNACFVRRYLSDTFGGTYQTIILESCVGSPKKVFFNFGSCLNIIDQLTGY